MIELRKIIYMFIKLFFKKKINKQNKIEFSDKLNRTIKYRY